MEPLCLWCEHFEQKDYEPGFAYSSYTFEDSVPAGFECKKGHFYRIGAGELATVRATVLMAKTCVDYQEDHKLAESLKAADL